jgi:hypothetical protein
MPPLVPGRELDTMVVETPVHMAAFGLVAAHVGSGLPWWAVVPACAVLVRATAGSALLRASAKRRTRFLGPLAGELASVAREGMQRMAGAESGLAQVDAMGEWLRRRRAVLARCEAGHFRRHVYTYGFVALAAAHVLGLRHAVEIDPSFACEGALWFESLAAFDPFLRLPVAAAAVALAALGRPPPRGTGPGARLGYWALAAASLAAVPVSWLFAFPNAISLHFLGAASYRLAEKTLLGRPLALPPPMSSPAASSGEPRPHNPLWEKH